jgi:hypothetical protein
MYKLVLQISRRLVDMVSIPRMFSPPVSDSEPLTLSRIPLWKQVEINAKKRANQRPSLTRKTNQRAVENKKRIWEREQEGMARRAAARELLVVPEQTREEEMRNLRALRQRELAAWKHKKNTGPTEQERLYKQIQNARNRVSGKANNNIVFLEGGRRNRKSRKNRTQRR